MIGKCFFCGYETELIEDIAESIDESKEATCAAEVGGIRAIHLCRFCYGAGGNHRYCCHYPNMYGEHDHIMKQLSIIGNEISDGIRLGDAPTVTLDFVDKWAKEFVDHIPYPQQGSKILSGVSDAIKKSVVDVLEDAGVVIENRRIEKGGK